VWKEQRENEPDGKREENDQKCRGTGVVDDGAFEAMNEIGGGKKKRDVLDGVGEKHKGIVAPERKMSGSKGAD